MKSTIFIAALVSTFAVVLGAALPGVDTTTSPEVVADFVMACKQDEIKCAGGNPGGAVFQCKSGAWIVIAACRPYENCKDSPRPHCTWAKQDGMMDPDFDVVDIEPEWLSNSD